MQRDALVVGINTYQHDGLQNLTSPAVDAEAIAQKLSENDNFQVWRLPEIVDVFDEARRVNSSQSKEAHWVKQKNLKDALVRLFLPQGKNIPDTALFFFSGHGLRQSLGSIQEGYLATYESNPDEDRWGLPLNLLRQILEKSPIRQQIIWLDCCHSGEFLSLLAEANPGNKGEARDRCFIAACREFEESWQDISSSYSVMTRVLVQGLDALKQQGNVDNLRLTSFINENLRDTKQRPVFYNVGGVITLLQGSRVSTSVMLEMFQPDVCPYKGLEAFGTGESAEQDYKFFFGRTALIDELLDKVRQSNFLAVLGPSGSGKSSVVRAGLLHQLREGTRIDSKDWKILVMRPGESPLQSLAAAFVPPSTSKEQADEICSFYEDQLKEQGAKGLRLRVNKLGTPRVVLVVDQFEEVFTRCQGSQEKEQERQHFFECLLHQLDNPDSKLCLIITMRADFLGKCADREYAGLAKRIQECLVTVTPMNLEELEEVIVKPAEMVGLQVDSRLTERILSDVKSAPGSLPLLQFTLWELWRKWHEQWQQLDEATREEFSRQIALQTYQALGGVEGTLESRANQVFAELDSGTEQIVENQSSEKQRIAKQILIELTQLGEGTEDTRRQIRKVALIEKLIIAGHPEALIEEVIQTLATQKLIVTGVLMDAATIDIVHEALIKHWTRLKNWINQSRDLIQVQRRIESAAKDWEHYGKTIHGLLQGPQLDEAKRFLNSDFNLLSNLSQDFLIRSIRKNNVYRTSEQIKQCLIKYQQELEETQEIMSVLDVSSMSIEDFLGSIETMRIFSGNLTSELEKIMKLSKSLYCLDDLA